MRKIDDHRVTVVKRPRATRADAILRILLQDALSESFGTDATLAAVHRRPSNFHSSYRMEEVDVHLTDGRKVRFIRKDLSLRSQLKEARGVKPRFLLNPRREISVYRHILGPLQSGTAEFHGAVEDEAHHRFWLLLENVAGSHLWQFGEFEIWREAARWLARIHEKASTRAACDPSWLGSAPLVQHDRASFERWARRARRCVSSASGFSEEQIASVRRITRGYSKVAERLARLPSTFIHGEFYPSNILISQRDGATQVRPIDWEMAGVGPACIDLAAFTAGKWTDEQRTDLQSAYFEAKQQAAGCAIDRREFDEQMNLCALHLAIQWLGWSAHWSPPKEHVQDWVTQAVRAAERIGL